MSIKKNVVAQRLEYHSMDGSIHDVSALFEPVWHYYSVEEGRLSDYVEFERIVNGTKARFKVNSEDLSASSKIRTEMFKHRIYYREFYENAISEYVVDKLDVLSNTGKVSYITDKLGWQKIDGLNQSDFILGPKFISGLGQVSYNDENLKFINGTKQNQLNFINKEVLPYGETRLALVLGLSSIVASYIEPVKSIGTLVINVNGQSSTGKSTIAELSASMFADPKTSNYGIVRTFNATKNFILGMSEGRNGLPIILDDANANANEHNKADLIYQFALGESRGRCDSSGKTQNARDGWSGLVIITSESPILENENVAQGAQVRTLSLEDIPWTQDASHSDRIKIGVRNDFGHIAPDIALLVQTLGISTLVQKHDYYTNLILQKMVRKDHFSSRMASKLAPIAITAEILDKYLGGNVIDYNEIIDYLVKAEQKSITKISLSDRVFQEFENFVSINRSKFSTIVDMQKYRIKGVEEQIVDLSTPRGQNYGVIRIRDEKSEVRIASSILNNFMKQNGFNGRNTIFHTWEEEGRILRGQPDRYPFYPTKKSHMSCDYYTIIMESLNRMEINESKYIVDPETIEDEIELSEKDVKKIEESNRLDLSERVIEPSKEEAPTSTIDFTDPAAIDEIFEEAGE